MQIMIITVAFIIKELSRPPLTGGARIKINYLIPSYIIGVEKTTVSHKELSIMATSSTGKR